MNFNPMGAEVALLLQKKIRGIESLRTGASVDEAVASIGSDHPLDLLLTDTRIKGGSCIDVLCRLSQHDFGVIFMSSDDRDFQVRSMIAAGFPFYSKYDDIQLLIALIETEMIRATRSLTAGRVEHLKSIIRS